MDHGTGDAESLPLKGAVLCSTAIDQDVRAHIVKHAEDMGAVYRLDLTSDVTHIIVGDINTAKYKHIARSRFDVHVLSVDWIYALRDVWTKVEAIDHERLLRKYRLPTFYGLKICVTGFSNLAQRQRIQDDVQANGGEYHGALTKQITHLIVASTEGMKYKQACAWNLTIVTLAWFNASIERGLVLDESYYSPTLPADRQGVGAIEPISRPSKRPRQSENNVIQAETVKRKIRRTASAKLDSQSQTLWADITNVQQRDAPPKPSDWVDDDPAPVRVEPALAPVLAQADVDVSPPRLFSEWTCALLGFGQVMEAKVRSVIRENGGIMCSSADNIAALDPDDRPCRVIIVPSTWHAKLKTLEIYPGVRYATEWWLERCVLGQRAFDPAHDIFSQPLVDLPASCFAGLAISSTGVGYDVLYLSKLIKAGGGEYLERFVSTASLLICEDGVYNNVKIMYAVKHNVTVVTKAWFLASLEKRERQPYYEYLLPKQKLLSARDDMMLNLDGTYDHTVPGSRPRGDIERPDAKKTLSGQRLTNSRLRATHSVLPLTRRVSDSGKSKEKRFASIDAVLQQEVPGPFITEPPSPVLQNRLEAADTDDCSGRLDPPSGASLASIGEPPLQSEDLSAPIETDKENMSLETGSDAKSADGGESKENLVNVMSELLNRQQTRSATADDSANRPRRRKNMKLGRAASGAYSSNLTRPTMLEVADTEDTASPLSLKNDDQPSFATDSTSGMHNQAPLPSQQLLYEAPGAEDLRRAMSKRLGCDFVHDENMGTRVQKLGVVQDADAKVSNAAGQRNRGKQRG